MVFLESFKGVAKNFRCGSISRVFQETFEGVSGVCLRVFEASSKVNEVYENFEGISTNF